MNINKGNNMDFEPLFEADSYSERDRYYLEPFFTNLNESVYVPLIFSPELIGALCSRTSRAADDLRAIFLKEFVYGFTNPVKGPKDTDIDLEQKIRYGKQLEEFISFLRQNSILDIFANPRARNFYITWLAQYGDDSIAQMAGMHLVFNSLSQVAIKHIEDQRISLAPIEKSTRYVNYSKKVKNRYRYYIDPNLNSLGLYNDYVRAMDNLFDTYTSLIPRLTSWLKNKFPDEKPGVVEKKAFDTLRGLLPMSTLSQVAFFGNGQSFEHLMNRSLGHRLGEIRWAAQRAGEELNNLAPAFLNRVFDQSRKEIMESHQKYLAEKLHRMEGFASAISRSEHDSLPDVRLIEFDDLGESKVIAGMLYSAPGNTTTWDDTLSYVLRMNDGEKKKIVAAYLDGRKEKWQKVGRAFENSYVRFEIDMNLGAWRDLHRHRMLTQQRQYFSCHYGYDIPAELIEAGLDKEFKEAIESAEDVYGKIENKDRDLAQYAVSMAHRIRFMQWENIREFFWESELRTIPEGHPDYRHVEQKKFRLLKSVFPIITEHMLVNMGEYDFARRGQEEKIEAKLKRLEQSS